LQKRTQQGIAQGNQQLDIRKHKFSQRIFEDWNNLSHQTVNAKRILALNSRLNEDLKMNRFKL